MGARREGRELALKLLYREEIAGLSEPDIPGLDDANPRAVEFAELLVSGVRADSERIDAAISAASEHWDIRRMGAVDRTIIRIGAYELLHEPGTPVGAVISEAVDAARRFSSEECGRFVNGVLDKIAREARGATHRGSSGEEDDALRGAE
ncbi:MAG: transcription antitermination factor NusB [Candidatus Eisenbacteria bacterium]|nr:transcription antitermination factor NusB [Candidatus Eisenbacteria bacterium]